MADPVIPDEPADVVAAELVLGLIDGDERAAALRRVAREPGFAAAVAQWRRWFDAWFEAWPPVEPPAHAAARLETALDETAPGGRIAANDGWRTLAMVASLATCLLIALAAALLLRPAPAPVMMRPAPPLLAAITPAGEGKPLPAAYDPTHGEVRITGRIAVPAGRAAQLWAIGRDGAPRSIGLLPGGGPARLTVTAARRSVLVAGTTLAISIEPVGGSPTGLPTGPVVATGELSRG